MTDLSGKPAATPVGYMERTRLFYEAQGYPRAYRWAQHDETPFHRLKGSLANKRLMLITTASPLQAQATAGSAAINDTLLQKKSLAFGVVAEPPAALFTDDLSWDKETTHTRDLDSYFPLAELKRRVDAGLLGSLTASYACVPTEYSQRQTIDEDAPAIRDRAQEEGADVALLVPL